MLDARARAHAGGVGNSRLLRLDYFSTCYCDFNLLSLPEKIGLAFKVMALCPSLSCSASFEDLLDLNVAQS